MSFDYKHLNITALSAVLFMSVYHVFSLILHGTFIISFLFLFNAVLSTLAILEANKQPDTNTKLTLYVLLLSCFSLFVYMLSHLNTVNSLSLWFCIVVFSSSILLTSSQALRLNLLTLLLYWAVILLFTSNPFQLIESALALTLITILISILSQITKELKNELDLSRKTDPITGCIQPNEFKPELAKVTQLFERYNTPFSLICIKYDSSFPSENDLQTWLKELAQLYQSRLRKTDILCLCDCRCLSAVVLNCQKSCSVLGAETTPFHYQNYFV